MPDLLRSRWAALLVVSGAASLTYEVVWLRRLSLVLGGSAVASAVTIGAFMAGLALGGLLADRVSWRDRRAVRAYAACEAAAAAWAVAFPWFVDAAAAWTLSTPASRWLIAAGLLIPPTTALGATWPLLARTAGARTGALLYATNTGGAVLGVVMATFVALPALGVRGTELAAAGVGLAVAVAALLLADPPAGAGADEPVSIGRLALPVLWVASFCAGLAALGLEVTWLRLSAVALGATVQSTGWVLATFLATMAAGALWGRRWPEDPVRGLSWGLGALGALALAGALVWGQLPLLVAFIWRTGGPEAMLPGAALVAVVAMGGAPAASGLAFTCAVRCLGPRIETRAGTLYAMNTLGCIVGAVAGGLWAVPVLEARGAVWLFAAVAAAAAVAVSRTPWPALPALLLAPVVPDWDAKLYAVGVHLRISDFADPSSAEVRRFAEEGWELLLYDHGTTGAVAVGRSTRTHNVWLSINGKVDASTGEDMPTQELSGILPMRMARDPHDALVVGLASGVTAGRILDEPGVTSLTIVELEPVVVGASRHFDHVNGRPLEDRRTTLVVDDARAYLARTPQQWDVIVSEPSNPWIAGVSSLFTLEYWQLVRRHLRPQGVACQWIQLYGMGPDELRGLVRTFLSVFPEAVLFETIRGSDVLLVGGALHDLDDLPLEPMLGPEALRRFAGDGWLNTDDRPRVEFEAPRWLHYDTGPANAHALRSAR